MMGSYTFSESGDFLVPVTVTNAFGYPTFDCDAWATATVVPDAVPVLSPVPDLNAVANVPLWNVPVATFTDDPNSPLCVQAVVTWEPGHSNLAQVAYDAANNRYVVSSSYTFGDLGPHDVEVDVYDADGTEAYAQTTTVNVSDGSLTCTPASISLEELTAGGIVHVGHVGPAANPAAVSADFTVTTDFGDGNVDSAGFLAPTDDGGFDVYATYDGATDYSGGAAPIQATVTEDAGQTGDATANVADNALLLDGGTTLAVSSLPASADLTVDGGSVLDLSSQSLALHSLTLAGGTVTDGSLRAASFTISF